MKKLLLTLAVILFLPMTAFAQTLTNYGEVTADGRMLFGPNHIGISLDTIDAVVPFNIQDNYILSIRARRTGLNYPRALNWIKESNRTQNFSGTPAVIIDDMLILDASYISHLYGTDPAKQNICREQMYFIRRDIESWSFDQDGNYIPGKGKSANFPNYHNISFTDSVSGQVYQPSSTPCSGTSSDWDGYTGLVSLNIVISVPDEEQNKLIPVIDELIARGIFPVVTTNPEVIAGREKELNPSTITSVQTLPEKMMLSK